MKDRIQVDGVWYVREDEVGIENVEVVDYLGCVYEDEGFCFDATKLLRDDGTLYDDVDIEFTDKRAKPWKTNNWDNVEWMREVIEPYKTMIPPLDSDSFPVAKAFILKLKEKGWL